MASEGKVACRRACLPRLPRAQSRGERSRGRSTAEGSEVEGSPSTPTFGLRSWQAIRRGHSRALLMASGAEGSPPKGCPQLRSRSRMPIVTRPGHRLPPRAPERVFASKLDASSIRWSSRSARTQWDNWNPERSMSRPSSRGERERHRGSLPENVCGWREGHNFSASGPESWRDSLGLLHRSIAGASSATRFSSRSGQRGLLRGPSDLREMA